MPFTPNKNRRDACPKCSARLDLRCCLGLGWRPEKKGSWYQLCSATADGTADDPPLHFYVWRNDIPVWRDVQRGAQPPAKYDQWRSFMSDSVTSPPRTPCFPSTPSSTRSPPPASSFVAHVATPVEPDVFGGGFRRPDGKCAGGNDCRVGKEPKKATGSCTFGRCKTCCLSYLMSTGLSCKSPGHYFQHGPGGPVTTAVDAQVASTQTQTRAGSPSPLYLPGDRLGDDPNIDEDGCESADVDFIAQYDAPYDALATVPPPPITIQPAPLPSLPVPLPAMHTVAPATVPPTAIQPAPPPSRPVPATRTVPHTTKALTVVHYNAQRNGENDRDTGVNRVAQQKENGAQADQTLQLWYWPSDDAPKPLPCRVACKQWPHFKLTHSWDFISAAFRLPGPRPLAIEMFHPVDQQWIVQELDIIEDVSKIGKVLLYRAPGVSEREDMLSKQADVIQGLPSRAKHPRTKPITSLSLGKPLPLPFLPIPAPQWSTESPPVTPSRPRKRQRSVSDGSPGSPLTKRQRDLSPVPIDEEPFDDIFEIPAPSPPPELLATKPSQRVTKPLRRQVTKPQTQRSLRQGTLPPIVDVDETVARTHKGAAWPFKDFALMAAGFQIMDELPKGCLPADMFALSFPSVAHLYKRATFYKHKGFWTKGLALGIQDEFVDRGPELLWGDFIATVAVALKRSKEQGEPSADSAIQDELMSADSGMDFGAQKESVVAASVTADSSTPLNLEPAASPNVTESMILPDEGLGELGWADDLIINPSLLLPDDLEHRIRALEAEITELWLDPCDNEFYQNYQQGDSSLQNFVLHFGMPRVKATAHLLDSICPEKTVIDVDRADLIHHVVALEVTTLMLMQDIRLSRDEALAFIGVQSSDTVMATEDDGIHIKVEELDDTRPLPGGLEGMVGVSVVEENGIEIIVID